MSSYAYIGPSKWLRVTITYAQIAMWGQWPVDALTVHLATVLKRTRNGIIIPLTIYFHGDNDNYLPGGVAIFTRNTGDHARGIGHARSVMRRL